MRRAAVVLVLLATSWLGAPRPADARTRWTLALQSTSAREAVLVMRVSCGRWAFPVRCAGRFRCRGSGCALRRGWFEYRTSLSHLEGASWSLRARGRHPERRPACQATNLFFTDTTSAILSGSYACWSDPQYTPLDDGTGTVQIPEPCWDYDC